MTSICIGITSFNSLPYLQSSILRIRDASEGLKVSVIIQDNASIDGTASWLPGEYLKMATENVKLYYSAHSFNPYPSYGCARSIDFFLTQTDCLYFFHLDPDALLMTSDALTDLITQIESDTSIGALGEKRHALRFQHPKSRSLKLFDRYIFSGEWLSDLSNGLAYKKPLYPSSPDVLLERHPSEDYFVYNELCGNVMFFKRKVIEEIGNVNARKFKMWRWDSEYSMRCLLYGYEIEKANVINEKVFHFGGRSRNKNTDLNAYIKQCASDLKVQESDIRSLLEQWSSD